MMPSRRNQMAQDLVRNRNVSVRFACQLFVVSESCYHYQPHLNEENDLIADWLIHITDSQRNWGFGLCFLYLRNVKGFRFNHKRVYRIYCELSQAIEVDFTLPASRVIRTLEELIEWKGKPTSIRCDNGPEYTGKMLMSWAAHQNITLRFIQPGKPPQNAYIERYNRTVRYDWLGQYLFTSLDELQNYATQWQWFYNNERPNMALNGYTPMQHIQRMT